MAISNSPKVFELNGAKVVFNFDRFQSAFNNLAMSRNKRKVSIMSEISAAACVSIDAVKNWRRRYNGPSELAMIQAIARVLEISDWTELLTNYKEEVEMKYTLSDRQKDAVKRIYDAVVDFLADFLETDGFNNYWYDLTCDPSEREDALYEIAEAKYRNVCRVYRKEFFDLNGTEIYIELSDYVYDDIMDTYDGKLSYAYRFEALVEEHPTTEDDYAKAINKINHIITKYL